MQQFFVYILKCVDDSYYVGYTDDMNKRLFEHQQGVIESSYVAARRPFELVFTEGFGTRDEAKEAERKLKGWSRKKKTALILGGWQNMIGYCKRNRKK